MREVFDIRGFNLGIISNADAEDIPPESASDSLNVDGDAPEGILRGIPTDVEYLTSGSAALGNVRLGAFVEDDNKYDLIYHDSSANKIIGIVDFYGAKTKGDLITSNVSENTCIVPNNKEVHIGTGYGSANVPKWVGHIAHGHYGGSAPSGLQIEDARLTVQNIITIDDVDSNEHSVVAGDPFQEGEIFAYNISVIYDGYQESPLLYLVGSANPNGFTITAGNSSDRISIDVKVTGVASLNKRITGINVWRAKAVARTSIPTLYDPIELWRLVETIDVTSNTGWTGTTDKTYTVTDTKIYGVTYNENTGISETLDETIVNYSLACKGNGHLFAGRCYHSEIPDAERYIFKSKEVRFDMFDWINDFLVMPEPITAMEFYEGKLYAFSTNKTYRINPEYLFIEDIFDDAGCQGQRAVHSTEYGLFFANKVGAWVYRGGQINPIHNPIKTGTKGWDTFTYATLLDIIVTSDIKKEVILFINQATFSTTPYIFAWAYNYSKGRWDALLFGAYTPNADAGFIKGKDGEVYLSVATNTYTLMRGATQRGWEWVSQKLSFGETRQNKSLTMIKADVGGTVTVTYGVDGASPATSYTNETLINSYIKNVIIKIVGNAGTNLVRSLEIIFRRLYGKR